MSLPRRKVVTPMTNTCPSLAMWRKVGTHSSLSHVGARSTSTPRSYIAIRASGM